MPCDENRLLVGEAEAMREPTTPDEFLELHKILRRDPQGYLKIVNQWIDENPRNSHAYFDRHLAWMRIGEPLQALEDINKVIELNPKSSSFQARGDDYRHLGQYEKALEDYTRGEAMDPAQWDSFALLYQADCHARLGDEASALACCARLPDDHWTPGMQGAPAGDKEAVADGLRRLAAEARRRRV